METIEENLKELQSMLSDENIKDIVKGFKELVEILKTFKNHQKIVNYDTKLRQVADYIIQDVMNSPCKEEILFNYALSEDEVNKRYRKLALNFHPDKTNRPNTPYSLQGDHKNLGAELFRYITEIKESLLANYEKS
ncbi:6337_t:CDS:2 [Funneliformis mosseae]|uniref:6337_t:CDS:1 n=1 Tax=Funneliformis mosseae TaxID=27381 RepID=A0A9N8ZTF1_FUNMO|nr:6337_t:CDS:2 [Funneliformis mosseae]